jgi:hypothetical protein
MSSRQDHRSSAQLALVQCLILGAKANDNGVLVFPPSTALLFISLLLYSFVSQFIFSTIEEGAMLHRHALCFISLSILGVP